MSILKKSVKISRNFLDHLKDVGYNLKNNYYILNRHNLEPGKTNPETGQ
jgi:hypothetical protein